MERLYKLGKNRIFLLTPNKYSHTREINRIIIPWIHPRDNYPFQLDYYFHERGKLSKR
jgi:Cu2+-containing amine oxidase